MSNPAPDLPDRLVVLGFDDELSAFALRELLVEMEDEGVLELGDAVIATRNAKGRVRLHQSLPIVPFGTALGGVNGMVLGMFLLNPLFGSVAGMAVGAAAASVFDVGINDQFMRNLGEMLAPGSSALFLLVRRTQPEPILERLKPFAGRARVLQSSMTFENESLLRNLLEGAPRTA